MSKEDTMKIATDKDGDDHDEVIEDPWCNANKPVIVNFEQISAAAYRIKDGIVKTPCDVSEGSEMSHHNCC